MLTASPANPLKESQERRIGRRDPRGVVGQRPGSHQGRFFGNPRPVHHAAHGETDHVRAQPIAVGAGLPEVTHRREHERRMPRENVRRSEARFFQRPRRLGFDPGVAGLEQRVQLVVARWIPPIQDHAALSGIANRKMETRLSIHRKRSETTRSTASRRFESQHVRTEFGEQAAAVLALSIRHVENAKTV